MGLLSEAHRSGLLMPGQNERFHSDNQLGMETTSKKLWCSEMIRKHNLIEVAVSLSFEVEASSRKGGKNTRVQPILAQLSGLGLD